MFARDCIMKWSKGSACYRVLNSRYGMQMDEGHVSFVSPRGKLGAASPHHHYDRHKNHTAMV
jgi:hypothetical protein